MSKPDCLFCRIVTGEIPAQIVFETDHILAFNDIEPKAPTHVLFIPKTHVESLSDVQDPNLYSTLFSAVAAYAHQHKLQDYRVVSNNGAGAGQSVFHWHVHLLAGRTLSWPPG
ncbi:MAG: histidine triad nucleotide-binding protein [Vampirovibrionales bacterium]|nr:histidine triad nucleotide-binding protein [Vampirovibrionales bacterium]